MWTYILSKQIDKEKSRTLKNCINIKLFLLNFSSMLIKDKSSLKQLIHLKKKLAAFTILFLCSNVPKFSCYNLIYHFDISQF
jgi:hypothetical protein